MRRFLIIISLLFVTLASWGQTDSVRLGYVVRGIVRDAQTGRALESVHVSVPGRNYASVTNADGEFILKSDRRIDAVLCTFVGYKSQWVAASEYIKVKLVRESIELQEASIISGDPMAIVLAAASRLKETYCPEPELLECFYRETVQKRNRYTYVAEAVARLYREKNDGRFFYNDVSALEKSRLLVSQRKKDTLSVKTQGGPQMALNCDFLKIPALLLAEDELALYRFDMELPAYIGDRLQFVIKLTPNRDAEYPLYFAKLYIDRERLTFTRIEASLDMRDRAKAIHAILVSKPLSLRFFPEEATVVLNYRPVGEDGERVRLEYFRSTIRFACDWKKRLFKTHYTAVNELVVTDVRPEAIPIPRKERFRSSDYLNDKAQEFQDPDFWADYNIIEPSESLEHAIGRLRK
ncbi:MAG: carboxypeptidase-like regulatory domain-containing protein [Bacteroidales bacterium]|nr:carboxypeptidase-like regulatory domain-containing protein [Bacteroidales bacterium]